MPLLTTALVLLCLVGPLSTDMYLPAFPRMAAELGTDAPGVQLTLTAFLLGMVLGHLVFGPLSDRYGRRGPLLCGTVACALATALCAVAPSPVWLTASRLLAGFSGAAGVVISRAVVSDVTEGPAAARLLGVLMALSGTAPVLAPLAGGAVLGAAGWRGVFWVLTSVALLVVPAVAAGVPESLPPHRRERGGGRHLLRTVGQVASDRAYTGHALTFSFGFGALFCCVAGSPFVLHHVLGLGVGASSVVFACGAVATTVSGAVNARMVGAGASPRRLLRAGLYAMLAATSALLAVAVAGALTLPVYVPLTATACGGLGLVMANSASLALARVPHAAGTGSALLGTAQSAVGALVAPLVGLAGPDTAVPVFAGMTACTALALLTARIATTKAGGESGKHGKHGKRGERGERDGEPA